MGDRRHGAGVRLYRRDPGVAVSAGFTPGPWKAVETDGGHLIHMGTFLARGRKAPQHEISYDHGLYVDDDYPQAQDEYAEAEANANLIAAAPELYAIGEKLMAIFDHPTAHVTVLESDQLRAALAKARGEQ